MRRFFLALALLWGSEAYAQEQHAVGSRCPPTKIQDDETVIHTACSLIYMPVGVWPQKAFYEHIPWLKSRNRLVPARPITAEAAPK